MISHPFLKQFLLHPVRTGAVAPTGEKLARLVVDSADLENAKVVVEFGPGTGVFTEKILQEISPAIKFFAIEVNPFFVEATQKRCPSAKIYLDSAENVGKRLTENGLEKCDCIISGLPWADFSEKKQKELLKAIVNALRPDGQFITFAYIQGLFLPFGRRFRKLLQKNFKKTERSKIVWRNIPPAFVYRCSI